MRLVFFGTPEFAVPSLLTLVGSSQTLSISGVITQPDRPRGRGQRIAPSPIKTAAASQGLHVLQPSAIKTQSFRDQIRELAPDLGIVVAYGRILPAELLAIPRMGMINVHASLLPRWRGAAPIHRAVIAGDSETGVTIMRVVEALDAGPMLAQRRTPIEPDETSEALEVRLATLGAALLGETVAALSRGAVPEQPQDDSLATYAARLERRESALNWDQPSGTVHNLIRGLQPWPLAAAQFRGGRVLLHRATDVPGERHSSAPGAIVRVEPGALIVATAPGAIRLTEIQLEGRGPVSVAAFLNGLRGSLGPEDRFERWSPAAP